MIRKDAAQILPSYNLMDDMGKELAGIEQQKNETTRKQCFENSVGYGTCWVG